MHESNQPIVVTFNPWEWSAQRDLTNTFFADVAIQLGNSRATNASELRRRLVNYGAYISVGSSIIRSLEALSLAAAPGVAPFLALVRSGLSRVAEVAEGTKEYDANAKSLKDMKTDLHAELARQTQNILVVLDDVDRLTTAETGALFQLIKVNADFPHLVYLVLCDPAAVEASLDGIVSGRGAEFLQKIGQVPFHLPQLLSKHREQMRPASRPRSSFGIYFLASVRPGFERSTWTGINLYPPMTASTDIFSLLFLKRNSRNPSSRQCSLTGANRLGLLIICATLDKKGGSLSFWSVSWMSTTPPTERACFRRSGRSYPKHRHTTRAIDIRSSMN